jgi:hypothetical protein
MRKAMSQTSLAERIARLEQQKARLAEQEARIKADQRKQRTRRLIEAGGLIEKAGLLDLEANALYGALLSLAGDASDTDKVARWAAHSGRAFAREAKEREAAKEPLTVTFPAPLPLAFTTALRAAGLRWNKVLQHWEGHAEHDAVVALAAEKGGVVQRVAAPVTSSAAE